MEFVPKPKRPSAYLSTAASEDGTTERPQDPLVASVMEEDQARKRAKKGDTLPGGKKRKDGLTLEQVEELEGGVIKESKTGMAATQRADRRKQKGDPDETGLLDVKDLRRAEQRLDAAEDDGITLEPFNLVKEREEGRFDESGNYVENKPDEDADPEDAWLASEEAKVLSDEVREKVELQKAKMASAEDAPSITPRETADLMRQLIEILQPGETVTRALKRLRPVKTKGKRKGASNEAPAAQKDSQSADVFERLTEASSTLMDAGELDVYSTSREDFEARAGEYPANDEDFDMFGDDTAQENGSAKEQASKNDPAPSLLGKNHAPQQAPTPQNPAQAMTPSKVVDYSNWPVKELARFLKERGQDPAGIIEKADLVRKVAELAKKGPEGAQPAVPLGYVWDPHSQYFFNSESGMYYDANSGAYFSAGDGQWYRYNGTTQAFEKIS